MYSESDLEAAVAGGALTAEQAAALPRLRRGRPAYAGGRRGAFPAADRLQRHLRRRSPRRSCSSRSAGSAMRFRRISTATARRRSSACSSRRPPGASPNSSPASGAWRCPASSCCSPSSAASSRRRRSAWSRRSARTISTTTRRPARWSLAAGAAIAAAAAWLHWRRFRVPITVAAGAAAVVALVARPDRLRLRRRRHMTDAQERSCRDASCWPSRWCSASACSCSRCGGTRSDPRRETRRSDVAFWLHLLAAPLIVHPVFTLLGLTEGAASTLDGGRS